MIQADNVRAFRESFCIVFCGKKNITSKCPEKCPLKHLKLENANNFFIRDVLEVKHGEIH